MYYSFQDCTCNGQVLSLQLITLQTWQRPAVKAGHGADETPLLVLLFQPGGYQQGLHCLALLFQHFDHETIDSHLLTLLLQHMGMHLNQSRNMPLMLQQVVQGFLIQAFCCCLNRLINRLGVFIYILCCSICHVGKCLPKVIPTSLGGTQACNVAKHGHC